MRCLLLTFLMCWAGLSMAGEGNQAAVPATLQELLESMNFKAVKCEPLEGAITCLPLSIAHSLELYDREHGASILVPVMNRFAVQEAVVSRFNRIDPRLRSSPHTQAAAVSYFLAERLEAELTNSSSRLIEYLNLISEQGHHSIILTAIRTLEAISQNAGAGELRRRADELINDVRRDLNQLGSFEAAILLSMATGLSIQVLNPINDSEVRQLNIENVEGQLNLSLFNLDLSVNRHYQGVLTSLDNRYRQHPVSLRFVASSEYGLLPLQNLSVLPEEQPVLVEATLRSPVSSGSNQCSAICYGMTIGDYRKMGFDGEPVKSRFSPKLKNRHTKKSIKDKWNRYYSQTKRQQPGKSGWSLYNAAWFISVSALSSYIFLNGQIRNAIYQEICGTSDVEQCGKNYLYYAKESGEYILETGYGAVCGADDARQCGSYYRNRSEGMASYILTAGYEKACGAMSWRECLKYYRGKDPAEVEYEEAGYRY